MSKQQSKIQAMFYMVGGALIVIPLISLFGRIITTRLGTTSRTEDKETPTRIEIPKQEEYYDEPTDVQRILLGYYPYYTMVHELDSGEPVCDDIWLVDEDETSTLEERVSLFVDMLFSAKDNQDGTTGWLV